MTDVSPAAAIIARGNNLVFSAPPSPAYAQPVLEAAVARVDPERTRPVLMVVPEAALGAWSRCAAAAARAQGRLSALGSSPGRAAHHVASHRVDLLVTTLLVATELVRRSALRLDHVAALILVWPELELSEESFVPVLADLPKETQRILITADPGGIAAMAERCAWRAPVVGPLGTDIPEPAPRFRTVAVSWDGREAALGAVADVADLDALSVWTADEQAGAGLAARLAGHGVVAHPISGPSVGTGPVVFFDPPPPELIAQANPDTAYLLAPPGTEPYLARVIHRQAPVTLPNAAELAGHAMTADRAAIRARIEQGPDRGAFATVAPLLDQWTATDVAVAIQSLWLEARNRPPAESPPRATRIADRRPQGAKVWASIGRKDGLTIGEWMGLLTLDLGIRREHLGKIDIRETFTLTEFPNPAHAREAAEKLAGHTFKNRRLTARLDRGPGPKRSA